MKKDNKKDNKKDTPPSSPQSTPPRETPEDKKRRQEEEKRRKKDEQDKKKAQDKEKKKAEEAEKKRKAEEKDKKKKEEKAKKNAPANQGALPKKKSSSQEKTSTLVGLEERRGSLQLAQLEKDEADFFERIEEGHTTEIDRFLQAHPKLNINSTDFTGVSALHKAIGQKNIPLVRFLLGRPDLEMRDAALLAVATEDAEFAAFVLDSIRAISSEREFRGCEDSSDYAPETTPLALAAMNGDYKMVRLLLDRGHKLEKPHSPDCLCPSCKALLREGGPSTSRIRLNAYRAVANPAYICQVTDDPILYCFVMDDEMEQCSIMDKEFRAEYSDLKQEVRRFVVELLSKCRDPHEVELLLKLPWGPEEALAGAKTSKAMSRAQIAMKKSAFPRLQLALGYTMKEILHCCVRLILLPIICIGLIVVPFLKPLRKQKSPLNRFLLHLVSYIFFLVMVFLLNHLDTGHFEKGMPTTGVEWIIIVYVCGHIWGTIRLCFVEGPKRFFTEPWNWYDMLTEFVFFLTFIFWGISDADAAADRRHKRVPLARKFWKSTDPTLMHEGLFAVGSVLALGKLGHYCLQSSRLGPLQVSMGKMLAHISYFLVLCLIIITSFANPLTRLYAYYDGMKQTDKDGNVRTQLSTFSTFRNSLQTLFWGMFGMSPAESADVVVENLNDDEKDPLLNVHDFTEGVGKALFATYELIMIIALVNTLIAVLSNTFQKVVDNADVEFKFARVKLWNRFFHDSTIVPPPFNLCPNHTVLNKCTYYFRALGKNVPGAKARFSFQRCCYVEDDQEKEIDVAAYETLMKNLVQRYFRSKDVEEKVE